MSIQINIGDHASPTAGYVPVPIRLRRSTKWARTHAKRIARTMPSADRYFQTLSLGRSLTDMLNDNTIWINYGPRLTIEGETNFAGGNEIAIGPPSYRVGRWTVLATLLHELAHVNGVRGAVSPLSPENALLHCGLGKSSERTTGVDNPQTPFVPGIRG